MIDSVGVVFLEEIQVHDSSIWLNGITKLVTNGSTYIWTPAAGVLTCRGVTVQRNRKLTSLTI